MSPFSVVRHANTSSWCAAIVSLSVIQTPSSSSLTMSVPVSGERGQRRQLVGEEIVVALAAPDELDLLAVHEHFGRERRAVVAIGHRHAVGARGEDREQIAAAELGKESVDRQEV